MLSAFVRPVALLPILWLAGAGCVGWRSPAEAAGQAPAVSTLAKTSQSWDGAALPAYPRGQPEVTILRIRIPPGARLETHRHAVINAGVLIAGQLSVHTTTGKTLELKAGDPIVEVVNTLHYGVNRGTVPADIIVVYAGEAGTPVTIVEPR